MVTAEPETVEPAEGEEMEMVGRVISGAGGGGVGVGKGVGVGVGVGDGGVGDGATPAPDGSAMGWEETISSSYHVLAIGWFKEADLPVIYGVKIIELYTSAPLEFLLRTKFLKSTMVFSGCPSSLIQI